MVLFEFHNLQLLNDTFLRSGFEKSLGIEEVLLVGPIEPAIKNVFLL